eukprot:SAG31_NODE_237_length_19590_cov_13.149915_10_plen_134_part_00
MQCRVQGARAGAGTDCLRARLANLAYHGLDGPLGRAPAKLKWQGARQMQPADSFLPRKRARTTAFCDAAVQTDPIALAELFYFVRAGRRYVRPYNYDFETHAKGRWVGRTLLQVFSECAPPVAASRRSDLCDG